MPDTTPQTTAWPAQQIEADQAVFAQAMREAAVFHDFDSGSRVHTADQRRQIAETARTIARRRGWLSLTERLAQERANVR